MRFQNSTFKHTEALLIQVTLVLTEKKVTLAYIKFFACSTNEELWCTHSVFFICNVNLYENPTILSRYTNY